MPPRVRDRAPNSGSNPHHEFELLPGQNHIELRSEGEHAILRSGVEWGNVAPAVTGQLELDKASPSRVREKDLRSTLQIAQVGLARRQRNVWLPDFQLMCP